MTLPNLPTDWKGWVISFLCTSSILRLIWYRNGSSLSWKATLLLSALFAFVILGLFTAIGFIPDDWSANRLTWSAGLLRGYPLYAGDNGPCNGFFYPPMGAWFYLPAAFAALYWKVPWLGQLLGWCLSMACVILPIFLAVRSSRESSTLGRLLSGLVLFCLVLSAPPLRYVATMIHVDAPSLLFIGLALHLLSDQLPSRPGQAVILGALLALAGWTKQSTWPFIPALLAAMCSLFGWRTAFKALNGLILTSLLLLSLLWIVESPSEMTRMIWHLPLSQTSVTSVTSALLLFLREGWPVLILPTVFVAQIFLDKNSLLEISHPCLLAKFLIALWMIPFAILTRTKLGADSNHLALPLFCILMASAPLLPKIADTAIFNRELYPLGSLIYLALLLLPALSLHAYLATNCSWYLWNHNSQQQAMERLQHPHQGLYLPWQILPMLIADGRLYHLDDCLRYENGMGWRRSRESLARFLPNPLTEIAIRPFGAPSYLAAPALPNHAAADLMLPGWATFHPRTFPQ